MWRRRGWTSVRIRQWWHRRRKRWITTCMRRREENGGGGGGGENREGEEWDDGKSFHLINCQRERSTKVKHRKARKYLQYSLHALHNIPRGVLLTCDVARLQLLQVVVVAWTGVNCTGFCSMLPATTGCQNKTEANHLRDIKKSIAYRST